MVSKIFSGDVDDIDLIVAMFLPMSKSTPSEFHDLTELNFTLVSSFHYVLRRNLTPRILMPLLLSSMLLSWLKDFFVNTSNPSSPIEFFSK